MKKNYLFITLSIGILTLIHHQANAQLSLGESNYSTFENSVSGASSFSKIKIIKFEVHSSNSQVVLKWATENEEKNDGFEIERSTDGKKWEYIGFEVGALQSTQVRNYEFKDEEPLKGVIYYRLRQMDLTGTYTFSNIKKVNL